MLVTCVSPSKLNPASTRHCSLQIPLPTLCMYCASQPSTTNFTSPLLSNYLTPYKSPLGTVEANNIPYIRHIISIHSGTARTLALVLRVEWERIYRLSTTPTLLHVTVASLPHLLVVEGVIFYGRSVSMLLPYLISNLIVFVASRSPSRVHALLLSSVLISNQTQEVYNDLIATINQAISNTPSSRNLQEALSIPSPLVLFLQLSTTLLETSPCPQSWSHVE